MTAPTAPVDRIIESLPVGVPAPTWRGGDGRIGWPDIFEYVWSTWIEHDVRAPAPPLTDEWPYRVEVKPGRLADYGRLVASNVLQDEIHRGRRAQIHESPDRQGLR